MRPNDTAEEYHPPVRLQIVIGCVATVMAASCISVGTAPPSPSASAPVSPSSEPTAAPRPDPPAELRAEQSRSWKADPKSWSVVLTWGTPPGFEADHYEVRRDDRMLEAELPGTRLVDQDVLPDTPYRYEVTAVGAEGTRSESTSVDIRTNAPPLADARLEGRFAMKMHITGQSGLQGGASGGGMLFVYEPACAKGPCDVTWSRKGRPGSGRLTRRDATYDGTVHASFAIGSCHGGTVVETLVFTTKVVEASVVRGAWRATKIEGTLHESAPTSGCVTATIDWSFAGFIQT